MMRASRWCLTVLLLLGSAQVLASQPWAFPYWSLEDYYQTYPDQQVLSKALDQRVQAAAVAVAHPPTTPISIMVVQPGSQTSDYWKTNVLVISKRLGELGIPFRMKVFNMRPDEEDRVQEARLAEALRAKPDYLITTLDTMPSQRILERILRDNHTKLILQNVTTPLKAWQEPHPFFYVGFDHQTGSEMLADYYLRRFPEGTHFSVIYWLPGYVSAARGDTFIRRVQARGHWQMDAAFYSKGTRNSAYDIASHLLGMHTPSSVIFCSSTDLAVGAADAVAAIAPGSEVWLNGWGGSDLELRMLQAGKIQATVMRMNDDSGIAIAEVMAADTQHQPTPQVYSGKMTLVTRDTSASELEHLTQQAFRYSAQLP